LRIKAVKQLGAAPRQPSGPKGTLGFKCIKKEAKRKIKKVNERK
jgi:hypothetical protein